MLREMRAAAPCVIAAILAACGGGLSPPPTVLSGFSGDMASTNTESGAPSKTLRVPGSASAVVALFPDGRALYSPDGYNLTGGGSTVFAYNGIYAVLDIEPAPTGIVALLSNGIAYFSPDGENLGGGGSSKAAASGATPISYIVSVQGGIDAAFNAGQAVYFSPDGLHLGGGGGTVKIYNGGSPVTQIVAVGTGVVSLLKDGSAYFSPNNRDLGGGGLTVSAVPAAVESVKQLVGVGGGVLAEFESGVVYLSPDGLNLAGGGSTVRVAEWNTSWPNAPFPPRDSAHGVEFQGRLWLSGGFDDSTGDNSCFTTCSYFDLWSSTNLSGTAWNSAPSFATATLPDPRDEHPVVNNGVQDVAIPTDFYDSYSAIVVWNNRLFAIGSTVWSSANGTDWARNNLPDGSAAPGPLAASGGAATENSRAFVLGSTLFFLQPDSGEVYSTVDPTATTWTDLGAIAGFTPRCGETAFVLLGKLWIEGGGACDYSAVYNDIWSSPDGVTWTRSDTAAAWPARMWGCISNGSVDDIWMVGGYWPSYWTNSGSTITAQYGENHSDVWYTKDGVNWRQFKADFGSDLPDGSALDPRHAATCYIDAAATGQSLIVTAGSAGSSPYAGDESVSNSVATLSVPAAAALP
jgi:hypothetical protein